MGRGKACKSCNNRWVQCQIDRDPIVSKPKVSMPKTAEDSMELGDGLCKKMKHKVVSKESIEDSKAKSKAEALDVKADSFMSLVV